MQIKSLYPLLTVAFPKKCLPWGKYASLFPKRERLFAKYAPLLSANSH